jgi:Carbohydrate/starch-binding module (family 21)
MPSVSVATQIGSLGPVPLSLTHAPPSSSPVISRPPQASGDPIRERLSYLPSSRSHLPKPQRKFITQTSAPIGVCSGTGTKPVKSSLKCSRSWGYHDRTVSAPAAPNARANSLPPCPKIVRFKDKDDKLESVCFFRAKGRPSSIFGPHSDTETEGERENGPLTQHGAERPLLKVIEMSPIPSQRTAPDSNVHLESISLLPALPPLLRGTVLVRNIAYEKHVTARFTTDSWTTTVETQASYIGGGPSDNDGTWDRFAFTISLEWHAGLASSPTPRTLLLSVRYTVPRVGEWWDNNGGEDFRVVFGPTARSTIPSWAGSALMSDAPFVKAAAFPRWPLVVSRCENASVTLTRAQVKLTHYAAPAAPVATNRRLHAV